MDTSLSIDKIFEMYGRVTLERDVLRTENERLANENRQLKSAAIKEATPAEPNE